MGLTKLTTDLIEGDLGGGTTWVSDPKIANFTAVAGEGYFVNTTSAAITVTLPGSPTAGDEVSIVDYAGTANSNNITVTSSDNINGAADDLAINYNRGGVSMVYVDATQGWIAYNAANETATSLGSPLPSSFSVDYLVVAGGGAGGSGFYGAGGGAGGLRTSYGTTTGGGGTAETELTLSRNTGYFLTVGAGGTTGGTAVGSRSGGSGSNSVFSTITSTGGGGAGGGAGQGDSISADVSGKDGGSGGGETQSNPYISTIGEAVTSPVVQGYNGGNSATNGSGAGGGGAGAVGANALSTAGNGGDGLAVNIISTTNAATASVGEVSGSDVYFAGGAGGSSSSSLGTGGLGGGADGDARFSGTPNAGSPNSGGGGAGAGNNTETGGTGGSGVVILRYPSDYTITETTSGGNVLTFNTYPEGSDKVTVFTAGENGTIEFS